MRAEVGDRVRIYGRTIDDPVRDGEVIEVHGAEGQPPYLIRWSEDGHQGLFFPGPDAQVQHFEHESGKTHEVRGHTAADGGLVDKAAQKETTQVPGSATD